jgi:hypothetical protein
MHEAGINRSAERVLADVNEWLDAHGIEAINFDDYDDRYFGRAIALYVNMGDGYADTLLYDTDAHTFELTTWADWSDEHLTPEPEPEPELPFWSPFEPSEPLIAVLRSVEGFEVYVHLYDLEKMELAFSVLREKGGSLPKPAHDTFFARQNDSPYRQNFVALRNHLHTAAKQTDVCYVGTTPVSIENSQFTWLLVALDAFEETGRKFQPQKEFLVAPPVLWTCRQLRMKWRGPGAAHPLVVYADDGDFGGNEYVVRYVKEEGLREAIDDGFVKWANDESVREWLHAQGVCRSV